MLGEKLRRDLRPDAQAFDEIRFVTIPRYKQSGLSGDEWRISVTMQFWRKGRLIHEEGVAGDMEAACNFAGYKYASACGNAHGYFAGEDDFCDQEGCANKALPEKFVKKFTYCRQGHKEAHEFSQPYRRFCEDHRRRGDCGLDDADTNYELIASDQESKKEK